MSDKTLESNVIEAVRFILRRDEDGNLLNPYLNEFESELFLKLSSFDSTSGESAMYAYQKKLKLSLIEAITNVVNK
jgi:hypothetical protein